MHSLNFSTFGMHRANSGIKTIRSITRLLKVVSITRQRSTAVSVDTTLNSS